MTNNCKEKITKKDWKRPRQDLWKNLQRKMYQSSSHKIRFKKNAMTHKHEMNKQIIRKGKEQNCFTVKSANWITFAFDNKR